MLVGDNSLWNEIILSSHSTHKEERSLDVTVIIANFTVAVCIPIEMKTVCVFNCLGVSVATCMAILQVGSGLQLRSASTGTKEEDYENDAATIVQKCVSIINTTFSFYTYLVCCLSSVFIGLLKV